jgi:hypothetical protein
MPARKTKNNLSVPSPAQAPNPHSPPFEAPDLSSTNGSRNGAHPIDPASLPELVVPEQDLREAEEEVFLETSPEGSTTDLTTVSEEELFVDDTDDGSQHYDHRPDPLTFRRPNALAHFMVRPGKEWRGTLVIIDYQEEDPKIARGKYLVLGKTRQAWTLRKGRGGKYLVVTCVTDLKRPFLWDIHVVEGLGNEWYLAFHDGLFARGPSSNNRLVAGQHTTISASDTIHTGLNKVLCSIATLEDAPIAGADRVIASFGDQAGSPQPGSILLKSFKPTSSSNTTPVAATTFGRKCSWICVGY